MINVSYLPRFTTLRTCVVLVCLGLPTASTLADQKKPAPAPAPHPAAAAPHPAAAAPAANHAAGATAGAAHGPTTGGGGGSAITTSGAHGTTTTTGGASHAITTSGAHTSTTTATGANHAVTTSGAHTTTAAGGHAAGGSEGGHSTPAAAGGAHPAGGAEHGAAAAHPSAFANHPAPAGAHEVRAANGSAVRTRPDGSRSDVHDAKRGMDIHHGLDGSRRVSVERPDHSRIVADRGGRGYVQHPYMFHGHEFGHRTYYEHGRAYDRFYGRYGWHGAYYDVYAPARFYPYGFYGYAYAPWPAPVPYAWGWGAAPWYGYYGAYYAPYPVYPAPAFWLADFVIAASLEAAFVAAHEGAADASPAPTSFPSLLDASIWVSDFLVTRAMADAQPAMTPEVKDMVANEIKALVQQEGADAQANAAHQDVDPAKASVVTLLSDKQPHVFVAGSDLDLVAASGQECALSTGDVLKVSSPPPESGTDETATVVATKNKPKECAMAATVTVALSDLQDMYNHMREKVDDGLGELQSKQGKTGIPAAPAGAAGAPVKAGFAAGAPPPDADAGKQISAQLSQADQAESETVASVSSEPVNDGPAVGQSIEQVTAALGAPTRVIDLGAKKIYNYPDKKIVFLNGKVATIE